jgi:hypothetical protein
MRLLGVKVAVPRLILAAAVAAGTSGLRAEGPDLGRTDRRIAKQPRYSGKRPLYGLFVFGPRAATHVWAVLDKSEEGKGGYDILYFDRNADGDLTDPSERWTGAGPVKVGAFEDPATGVRHENLTISWRPEGSVSLSMNWKGKEPIMAGCAEHLGHYCAFADSPDEAPILWPGAEEPLAFQRCDFDKNLRIGRSGHVFVYLGHQGVGPNTFSAVTQEFLAPEVSVLATLIYKDGEGKERRSQSELRERC